uniref:Uncharacterized protein n=1 Tax=Anguilla anguilla TaxID=7936 RepID=A0A0E9V1K3_ANGAN
MTGKVLRVIGEQPKAGQHRH